MSGDLARLADTMPNLDELCLHLAWRRNLLKISAQVSEDEDGPPEEVTTGLGSQQAQNQDANEEAVEAHARAPKEDAGATARKAQRKKKRGDVTERAKYVWQEPANQELLQALKMEQQEKRKSNARATQAEKDGITLLRTEAAQAAQELDAVDFLNKVSLMSVKPDRQKMLSSSAAGTCRSCLAIESAEPVRGVSQIVTIGTCSPGAVPATVSIHLVLAAKNPEREEGEGAVSGGPDVQAEIVQTIEAQVLPPRQVARLIENARIDTESKVKMELKQIRQTMMAMDERLDQLLAHLDGLQTPESSEPALTAEAVAQLLSKTEQQWGQEIRTLKQELHQTILAHNHNADLIKHHKDSIDALRERCGKMQGNSTKTAEIQLQLRQLDARLKQQQKQRKLDPLFERLSALELKVATGAQSGAWGAFPRPPVALPPGISAPPGIGIEAVAPGLQTTTKDRDLTPAIPATVAAGDADGCATSQVGGQ
ncbi:ISA3 [Symbiodinium pilosum]|uniref:ISA3 protein n=1 Tax=Symbiodinium pilosum TaxID=2952 RepID=A0A812KGD4_SYMPI|nr:ISA3 [Symbiodinium pilosum]